MLTNIVLLHTSIVLYLRCSRRHIFIYLLQSPLQSNSLALTKQPYSPTKNTTFFVCLINISYFCNRLSQSIKGRRVKTSWIHASTTAIEVGDLISARSIKGRFQTLSSTIKLRNFDPIRRYRNEASTQGVLYLYVCYPIIG